MDLEQSVMNQTHVSATLTAHLLSKKPNSNVVFSPLSIQVVLSLLAAGSKGQTLDQLLAFLKTDSANDLNSLYSQLVSSTLVDGSPNGGPRLSFANGLWVDKTLSLKPSFKHVVDTVYQATCDQLDFKTKKPKEIANEVNLWAENQTNGLIKKVLPSNAVNKLTRLIFTNGIYFQGVWKEKFDQSKTKKSDFHLLDGNKVEVPFMTSGNNQYVREYHDFKVLGLPYLDGQDKRTFTMYFFLPDTKTGLQSLVEKISSTSDFLDRHIPYRKVAVGKFLIPKFEISFGFEASKMLKELGLILPFNNGDGLTEMVYPFPDEGLYVSSIHHKSFVEVNEKGTKAAAVSVLKLRAGCARRTVEKSKEVDFVADHPFLFVIREDVSEVVLFMGQVVDPRVG